MINISKQPDDGNVPLVESAAFIAYGVHASMVEAGEMSTKRYPVHTRQSGSDR